MPPLPAVAAAVVLSAAVGLATGSAMGQTWRLACGLSAWIVATASCALPAQADDFVDRADATYKTISSAKRSDSILLPLILKMEPTPTAASTAESAALLPADSASFAAAAAWATGAPQKAVIEALVKVTSEKDWKSFHAFGQPYSFSGIDPDLVVAGAYTFLGDPPVLASADHQYLTLLDRLEALTHVEITRLTADGKAGDALDLGVRFTFFARTIADRAFFREQSWGYRAMLLGLQRIRDVAYVDFRSAAPALTPDQLKDAIARLVDRGGVMGTDRLTLPQGDKIAAEQLIAQLFLPRAGPNPDTFGRTLARIGAQERPLRLFSETARWDGVMKLHANALDTRAQLDAIYNDWAKRWALSPFEPMQRTPSDFSKMDKVRFAALDATMGDVGVLFNQRLELRAELVSTRMSLAMYAFFRTQRSFPRDVTAVRPAFIARMDPDPFSLEGKNPEFFVPIRDALKRPNEDPKPHVLQVLLVPGQPGFEVSLKDDQFVMFLIGPDRVNNNGRKATQMVEDRTGDFIAWPPVLSLQRQYLKDTGRLP